MSEPLDQDIPQDPHDGIDATDNPETRTYDAEQTPALSRASSSGPVFSAAPEDGATPDVEGTGAGDPLGGVRASEADVAEAVPGDEGPEHGGVRRST